MIKCTHAKTLGVAVHQWFITPAATLIMISREGPVRPLRLIYDSLTGSMEFLPKTRQGLGRDRAAKTQFFRLWVIRSLSGGGVAKTIPRNWNGHPSSSTVRQSGALPRDSKLPFSPFSPPSLLSYRSILMFAYIYRKYWRAVTHTDGNSSDQTSLGPGDVLVSATVVEPVLPT